MSPILAYVLADDGQAALQAAEQFALLLSLMLLFSYCWFLQEVLLDLPAEDRRAAPWLVWLMFLPLVGPVFAWLLLPFRIPASFAGFFARQGENEFGDCGRRIGLIAMIVMTLAAVLVQAGLSTYGGAAALLGLLLILRYTWLLMRMRRRVRQIHRLGAAREALGRPR